MNDPVIEARGLTRYFGRKCVVDRLNLSVPRGCVFGFLGRNGAGKTTTIRMLLGLLAPTRGSCSILGNNSGNLSPEVRARVGYLAEGHHVYDWMRVSECGRFQSQFFKHWNGDLFHAVVDYFNLDLKAKAGSLSRGERAGLCLALTLAPEPEVYILDDPSLGLDSLARRALLEAMVYITRRQDRTILFSSHLLSDVERVADQIAVVDAGRLRACCSVDTFRERVRRLIAYFSVPPLQIPDFPELLDAVHGEHEIAVTVVEGDGVAEEQLRRMGAERVERVPIDLEEAFISYVGNRGRRSLRWPTSGNAP